MARDVDTPAVMVRAGTLVFLAGVTAGPVYHPDVPAEFDHEIPVAQAELAREILESVIGACPGTLDDIVQVTRFIVDEDHNQDAINQMMGRYFGQHRLAHRWRSSGWLAIPSSCSSWRRAPSPIGESSLRLSHEVGDVGPGSHHAEASNRPIPEPSPARASGSRAERSGGGSVKPPGAIELTRPFGLSEPLLRGTG